MKKRINNRIKQVLPFIHKKANELRRLYRLSPEDREDMLQTGLLRLAKVAGQYNPTRSKWITFATVVTVNAMRSWLKNHNRQVILTRKIRSIKPISNPVVNDPRYAAEITEAREIFIAFLVKSGLQGTETGKVLSLYYLDGFTSGEIANIIGTTAGEVKKTIMKAKRELRKMVK